MQEQSLEMTVIAVSLLRASPFHFSLISQPATPCKDHLAPFQHHMPGTDIVLQRYSAHLKVRSDRRIRASSPASTPPRVPSPPHTAR